MMTLPDLSSDYELTQDQIESFQRDGHILLRGVASAEEIEAYRPAIVETADRFKRETRPLQERDTYGKAFLQITNLWVKDDTVKQFVTARRFAKIAGDLMKADGVRLYHDQALFKEGGGGITPWHQDQYYWPLDTPLTVTMWITLVDVSVEMGPMRFASGTHRLGFLGEFPIGDDSQRELQKLVEERGLTVSQPVDMKAGDATFHAGWILHNAPPNETDRMREAMTVIYYPDGTKIGSLDRQAPLNDRNQWVPGCEEGELAVSPLNPLLYP